MAKGSFIFSGVKRIRRFLGSFFWFFAGFLLAGFFLISFFLIFFQFKYQKRVIPGVYVENIYIGGKTKSEVEKIFEEKNKRARVVKFIFSYKELSATASAEDLGIGYNPSLLADQGVALGKSKNQTSNFYIILTSYLNGIFLSPSYTFSPQKLKETLSPVQQQVYLESVDALFSVKNGRVVAFRESQDGQTLDFQKLEKKVQTMLPVVFQTTTDTTFYIDVPIKKLLPKITTEQANNLGIVEVIGEGKSRFVGSILNRIHNIALASARLNGILIAPGEALSFNAELGDVSKFTGYKEAYIIKDGKTILGDGGGVCQVSTTLFRAILNAGLPITERHAHSYRVSYYEQDSPPGLDATVYAPSVDLKFRNDTSNHILIQSFVNPQNLSLTFILYGKRDGRIVKVGDSVISNQTPPPLPLYQDDPNLPRGVEKQVDFSAPGAAASFGRTVTKDGEVIISDKYVSRYIPWQAVFLRGTKE